MASKARQGWSWSRIVAGCALIASGMAVAFDAWADIFHIAMRDEEASHVFLVPD